MDPHFKLKTYVILKLWLFFKRPLSISSILQGKNNHFGQHCLGREYRTNSFSRIISGLSETLLDQKKMAYSVMDGKIIDIISFQIVKWYAPYINLSLG